MARTGVTREQVFAAADALAEEGIQPTVKLVRDRIGGSYSTITPHLAAWKDERSGRGVANVPDMPESVAAATRAIWAAAWNAGQAELKTERDGLTAARRELEKERADMAQEIAELERKLEAGEAERDSLTAALTKEKEHTRTLEERVSAHTVENARLTERIENQERRADELREQVIRLEGELARLARTSAAPPPSPRKAKPPRPDER